MRLFPPPFEEEPDGNRFLLHHALWGWAVFAVGWYLWFPGGDPALGSVLAMAGVLVVLDDVVDHALGGHIRRATEAVVGRPFGIRVGTPIDFIYRVLTLYLRSRLTRT